MHRLTPAVLAFATSLFFATHALAAQRAFVASYGNDSSAAAGCLLANPCRTFTAAMTAVDAGGEVIALDAAGYGSVVITKSVTITTNPGYFAGISVASGHGIELNGPIRVVLRGLNINAIGGGALSGIHITNADSLTVEDCIVSNFPLIGINSVFAAQADLHIVESTFRGNGVYGILVGGGSTATIRNVRMSANAWAGLAVLDNTTWGPAKALVTDSDSSGNGTGFLAEGGHLSIRGSSASANESGIIGAGAGARVAIAHSSIVGNTYGLQNFDGLFESYGNNLLRYNSIPTEGAITLVGEQ